MIEHLPHLGSGLAEEGHGGAVGGENQESILLRDVQNILLLVIHHVLLPNLNEQCHEIFYVSLPLSHE